MLNELNEYTIARSHKKYKTKLKNRKYDYLQHRNKLKLDDKVKYKMWFKQRN